MQRGPCPAIDGPWSGQNSSYHPGHQGLFVLFGLMIIAIDDPDGHGIGRPHQEYILGGRHWFKSTSCHLYLPLADWDLRLASKPLECMFGMGRVIEAGGTSESLDWAR